MSLQLANPKLESEERSCWHWLLAPDGTPSTVDQAPATAAPTAKAKSRTKRGATLSVLQKRLPLSSSNTDTNRGRSLKRRRTEETYNHDDDVDDDNDDDCSSSSSSISSIVSSNSSVISRSSIRSNSSTKEDGMIHECDAAPPMGRRGSGQRTGSSRLPIELRRLENYNMEGKREAPRHLRRRHTTTGGFDEHTLSNGEYLDYQGDTDAKLQREEIVVVTQDDEDEDEDEDDELGWIFDGESTTSVVPMDKTIQMCEEFLNRPSLEGMKNPLTMTNIETHQARDLALQRQILSDPHNRYQHREFQHHDIICFLPIQNDTQLQLWKIVIAESLLADVLRWYHLVLGPSDDHQRLYDAISTRFYAPNLYEQCYFFRNPDHTTVPLPSPPVKSKWNSKWNSKSKSKSEPPYPVTPPEFASTSTASHTSDEEHQGVPNEPESPHPVTSESTSTSSRSSSSGGDENQDVLEDPPRQVRLETMSPTSHMDESENETVLSSSSSSSPPPQAILEEMSSSFMGENKHKHETTLEELPCEVTPEKTSTSHSRNSKLNGKSAIAPPGRNALATAEISSP